MSDEITDQIRLRFGAAADDVIAQCHRVARDRGIAFEKLARVVLEAGPASLGAFVDHATRRPIRS